MNPDLEKSFFPLRKLIHLFGKLPKKLTSTTRIQFGRLFLLPYLMEPLYLLPILSDISVPLRLDCTRVSSYGNSTNPETAPRILGSLKSEVQDKHVLLVDDILDTGNTMEKIFNEVSSKCPASLKTCVFLDKPERRENNFQADWSGFNIPDEFVVGYGLDYAGRYRELPYLGTLKPAIYSQTPQ